MKIYTVMVTVDYEGATAIAAFKDKDKAIKSLRANVPIKVISKAAGHVNSTITERYYAHLEDKTVLSTIAAAVR